MTFSNGLAAGAARASRGLYACAGPKLLRAPGPPLRGTAMPHRLLRLLALLLAALPAGAAAREVVAPPTAERPNDNWRLLATEDDRSRVRRWRTVWTDAIARARAAGHGAEVDAEGPLLDPDAALGGALPPPGDYDCRTIKVGARSAGLMDYAVYPRFLCRIEAHNGRLHFTRLDGSQRPIGILFADSDRRLIFLGTLQLGDESLALRYSRDTERDMIGLVERIGARRWRIGLPAPHFESLLDVIELVPRAATDQPLFRPASPSLPCRGGAARADPDPATCR
jgi:Domain of unknown function (DUF4893)